MAEQQYKTIEEIEARLKDIKKIKALVADAKKANQEDLIIYTQKLKLRAGDYEIIQEIKDEINSLDEKLSLLLMEENMLKLELRYLRKQQAQNNPPQPM